MLPKKICYGPRNQSNIMFLRALVTKPVSPDHVPRQSQDERHLIDYIRDTPIKL